MGACNSEAAVNVMRVRVFFSSRPKLRLLSALNRKNIAIEYGKQLSLEKK